MTSPQGDDELVVDIDVDLQNKLATSTESDASVSTAQGPRLGSMDEPPFLFEISVPESDDEVPTLWEIDQSVLNGVEDEPSPRVEDDIEILLEGSQPEFVQNDISSDELVVELDLIDGEESNEHAGDLAEVGGLQADVPLHTGLEEHLSAGEEHEETLILIDADTISSEMASQSIDSADAQGAKDMALSDVIPVVPDVADIILEDSSDDVDTTVLEQLIDDTDFSVDSSPGIANVLQSLSELSLEPDSASDTSLADTDSNTSLDSSVLLDSDLSHELTDLSSESPEIDLLLTDEISTDSVSDQNSEIPITILGDTSDGENVSTDRTASVPAEPLPGTELIETSSTSTLAEPESDADPAVPALGTYSERVHEETNLFAAINDNVAADKTSELPPPELYGVEENDDNDEIIEIFLEEAEEIIENVQHILEEWKNDPDNLVSVARLQRDLHTIKGGARMAEQKEVAELCHELETLYERISNGRLTTVPELFGLLQEAHDSLGSQLDDIRDNIKPQPASTILASLHSFMSGGSIVSAAGDSSATIAIANDDTPETSLDSGELLQQYEVQSSSLDESDREILEIFLEEAAELHESLEKTLNEWETGDASAANEVQRVLHTLKGGARLAGLVDIGNLAHDFESNIVLGQQGRLSIDSDFFKNCYQRQDALVKRIERVSALLETGSLLMLGEASVEEADVPESNETDPTGTPPSPVEESTDQAAMPVVEAPVQELSPASAVKPAAKPMQQQQVVRKAPQELVKVSADLLDDLVNLAGETSIGRGRLEQQVVDFSHTLDEMDMTLDRLRDQLRRLDIETEAQVLFRQERQGPAYEDFDPLEMDRYSTIQQLSRALVESASDLHDLRETLGDKTRDAETLLLQQSRVNTELQEGLMKTRMVPFQRLVPRLRRIVRQVSLELGKQVEFRVLNADGELDRTILERMISPLEHMVRNAVDHGVESPEERRAKGKPELGSIELEVSRDGGDVVLTLRDDGDGVNLSAVRKKAIERGMLEADASIDDHDLIQFILQAGFSTAKNVTQISGRGVGLDVVSTEIKQMGGSVEIHSEKGSGTRFEVRLPFTVSVNRALMVKVGDDLYAVPLNNIQGIVRISAKDLQEQYEKPQQERLYKYGDREYRLDYLAGFLDNEAHPKFTTNNMPLPVLLVHGAVPFALQVDTLLGSREIVVKALGPQFSSVMGVSGGTILGDGSVVIILDLPAMIRTQASLEYQQAKLLDQQAAEKRKERVARQANILVVDDSVTVRKVTSRLLERNGMSVRTAKDGMDAMETLQDHRPDLMLLDIEMPRMDGFEVASLVRHDSVLSDIPIIMITSRTGDKHRDRALSIGVNEYMGKPFQEDQLLASISKLLDSEVS